MRMRMRMRMRMMILLLRVGEFEDGQSNSSIDESWSEFRYLPNLRCWLKPHLFQIIS